MDPTVTPIPTVPPALDGVITGTLVLIQAQPDVWTMTADGNGIGAVLLVLAGAIIALACAALVIKLARP